MVGGTTAGSDNTDEALAAFGLVRDGPLPAPAEIAVFPCNWKAVRLFHAMGTQWRVGMNGATGLDYRVLPLVAKAAGIKLKRQRVIEVQTMERAALAYWSEQSSNGR